MNQKDDCVSRQAVLEIVEREQNKGDALSEIEKLPPVTHAEKVGKPYVPDTNIGKMATSPTEQKVRIRNDYIHQR